MHVAGGWCLQAKDKARKEVEKAMKIREPLAKKMAQDPDCLNTLEAEISALKAQLEAMGL